MLRYVETLQDVRREGFGEQLAQVLLAYAEHRLEVLRREAMSSVLCPISWEEGEDPARAHDAKISELGLGRLGRCVSAEVALEHRVVNVQVLVVNPCQPFAKKIGNVLLLGCGRLSPSVLAVEAFHAHDIGAVQASVALDVLVDQSVPDGSRAAPSPQEKHRCQERSHHLCKLQLEPPRLQAGRVFAR